MYIWVYRMFNVICQTLIHSHSYRYVHITALRLWCHLVDSENTNIPAWSNITYYVYHSWTGWSIYLNRIQYRSILLKTKTNTWFCNYSREKTKHHVYWCISSDCHIRIFSRRRKQEITLSHKTSIFKQGIPVAFFNDAIPLCTCN